MSLKLAVFCGVLLSSTPASAQQKAVRANLQPISQRRDAPAFALQDSSGKTATLDAYHGKVLLLDFWATWCGGCKQEIPWFVEIQKSHSGTDLALVGVSLDDGGWKILRPYLSAHAIPYRIVLGNHDIAKQYGIQGMPDTFLIDRQGRVAATYRAGVVDRSNIDANINALLAEPSQAATPQSKVLSRHLLSHNFAQNKIGTDPDRQMSIYLPPGYDQSAKRYPVIYYLPNGPDSCTFAFEKKAATELFDSAIRSGVIGPFILVSPDMNTPLGSSWSVNSSVTGQWEDFMTQELVPYVDVNFRTLADRSSRGLLGDRMGGYGAIRFAMRHPEVFGSVYALHPVGTGSGLQVMYSRPDWNLLWNAQSIADVKKEPFSSIFTSIFQAHLPNPDQPPLFIDLPARKVGDRLIVDSALTERLQNSFLLDRMIPQYANNLKSLRGFKFDSARSDPNQDHVYANQAFTHKLDEFGIPHEAEEYRGLWGDRHWGEDGRIYTDVLPFFRVHLAVESGAR